MLLRSMTGFTFGQLGFPIFCLEYYTKEYESSQYTDKIGGLFNKSNSSRSYGYCYCAITGNTVNWYNLSSVDGQANVYNETYLYFGIS